jgi:hypothetical protein
MSTYINVKDDINLETFLNCGSQLAICSALCTIMPALDTKVPSHIIDECDRTGESQIELRSDKLTRYLPSEIAPSRIDAHIEA